MITARLFARLREQAGTDCEQLDLAGTVGWFTTEFPVGYKVTIDATAKDVDNRDTLGSANVDFFVSDDSLIRVGGNHNSEEVQEPANRTVRLQRQLPPASPRRR